MMCEQLGTEPKDEEIPVGFEDFPYEVQEALQIFYILPDIWDGMSGTYMGKDYTLLKYLMEDIFEVSDRKQTMQIILIMARLASEKYARMQEERNRQNKTKSKKKGINVNG